MHAHTTWESLHAEKHAKQCGKKGTLLTSIASAWHSSSPCWHRTELADASKQSFGGLATLQAFTQHPIPFSLS